MKQYLRLFRLQINQRFGLSALRADIKENPKRTVGRAALFLLVILSFGMLIGMYTWLVALMMPAFQSLQMEKVLLGLLLLVSMVFVFFMGMIYLIGTLFFARDTEFLASLPIPQRTVFAAKFSQVLLGEIGTGILLLAPPFIVYGVMSGAGVLFWLAALLVVLIAPCIPLALSALLSLVLMRFTALWRRRDLITVIGSVLLIVGVFVIQGFMMSSMPEEMTEQTLMALIADNSGVLRMVVSAFPPAGWAAEGLMGSGTQLLLFAGVSALALALVVVIAGRIYYSGAMAQLETASVQRAVKINSKTIRRHSSIYAMFMREWRALVRTPVYVLNGLTTVVIGPLLLLIPMLFQGSPSNDMEALMSMVYGLVDNGILLLVLVGLFVGISVISPAASTTVSREGKLFWLLRTLPVSPQRQIMAKFLFGMSIALLTMLLLAATSVIFLGLDIGVVAAALLLGLLASIAPLGLSQLLDVLRPKLAWNNETEAIKQNMNAMLGMVIGWAYVALLGYGCYLAMQAGVGIGVLIGAVAALSAVFAVATLLGLGAAAKRTWNKIEG